MSAAERERGRRAEVAVVNYLRAQGWPDARRYLAGDGRQPGDIDWHPLICLEVKDRKQSAWPSWCRQAAGEARDGLVPAVVRRTRGVPDVGRWECRVQAWGWFLATGESAWDAFDVPKERRDWLVDDYPWLTVPLSALVAAVREIDSPARAGVQ